MMEWVADPTAGLPGPNDRGFAYGDGLFETIAVRDGSPRLLRRHMARLQLGAARLALPLPPESGILSIIEEALDRLPADAGRAVVKLVATRGDGERGYRYRRSATRLLAGVAVSPTAREEGSQHGVSVRWCRTRLGRNTALAGIKHLNRLEQVIARAEWTDEAVAEGLMLDTAGRVVCATMSNLFAVTGGRLLTPAITHAGVAGVMRGEVLEVAQRLGLAVEVREMAPADILTADELFLTNSQFVIRPLRRLGRRTWSGRPVTEGIVAELAAGGVAERG